MKFYSVSDPEFRPYGQILEGYDTLALVAAMRVIQPPKEGLAYEPSIPFLEDNDIFGQLQNNAFGGMSIQLGMCWGCNTKLNCLEYHRSSEVNVGSVDFVLLLAKLDQVVDGMLDTATVKAFIVPAGVPVEIYATSLHYAPCRTKPRELFRVAVALPRGTNTALAAVGKAAINEEAVWLTAHNKWLLAHPESVEASQGAHIGLKGENIDLASGI